MKVTTSWTERARAFLKTGASPTDETRETLVSAVLSVWSPAVSEETMLNLSSDAMLDLAPSSDPNRYCWPYSTAMNTGEIDTFTARLAQFTDKGVSDDDAEQLADDLVLRDREGDDRRLCLECSHLQGVGRLRCGNSVSPDMAREGLANELVTRLRRCLGFRSAHPERP